MLKREIYYWQEKYEMIILNKSDMNSFIIGNLNYDNAKGFINYRRIPELKELQKLILSKSYFRFHIYLKKIFIIYNITFFSFIYYHIGYTSTIIIL